jgi:hypothetical protein
MIVDMKMFLNRNKLSNAVLSGILTAVGIGIALSAPSAFGSDSNDAESETKDVNVYKADFQTAELGAVPNDFLVLLGAFEIKADGAERFLELPGKPLETFGTLLGPESLVLGEVSARLYGEATGRRYPALGVGFNGVGGFRLQVTPAKRALEIYNYDELFKSTPYRWKSGEWLWMKLNVSEKKTDDGVVWLAQGKVWQQGEEEPEKWMIEFETDEEPFPGRASLWGIPYSDKPIRFDDVKISGE